MIEIKAINQKIEELKEQKKQFNTQMKKLVMQYANQKLIVDGPDRGYIRTEWQDDAAEAVHEELRKQWYNTNNKIDRAVEARRKITQAEKILQEIL